MGRLSRWMLPIMLATGGWLGCDEGATPDPDPDHGDIAEGIMGPLGSPLPTATPAQLEAFDRGLALMEHQFSPAEGLGPAFNVTFCGACHEKPTFGGSAGTYRNFFIGATKEEGEALLVVNPLGILSCGDEDIAPENRGALSPPPASETGASDGVIRNYYYGAHNTARPDIRIDPQTEIDVNVVTSRNPIPFFGAGLMAEISDEEILSRVDADDKDGDGISGEPNLRLGFVGRFGVKGQTASIEGFIRGPLFNHLGITTDPLTEEQRAMLPVDSSSQPGRNPSAAILGRSLQKYSQAAASSGPNCDFDAVPDPEMSRSQLFDLVSFSMLLAAPEIEPINPQRRRGMTVFNLSGCGSCHTPRLNSPRGPLPVYSDLLVHDMGPELADNMTFGFARESEFKTQPLWGLAAVGPYLHDGRAQTIDEAILWHGGEAESAKNAYEAASDSEKADLNEFLLSLGGRSQFSQGLLPPGDEAPARGNFGGPRSQLSADEASAFEEARVEFDRERGFSEGVGGPRFNGDSCRACHFEPTMGGSGPSGVNVVRHAVFQELQFSNPRAGSVLHKASTEVNSFNAPEREATYFEHRQTPALFGLGLLDDIDEVVILANQDPEDADGDGISGRAPILEDGRLGRFGWKAQVPTLREFVRDAVSVELGMTLAPEEGSTFGATEDSDGYADPEFAPDEAERILYFMKTLGPPPRSGTPEAEDVMQGEALFAQVSCTGCHVPALEGPDGPVAAYTDMLLHDMAPAGTLGIAEGAATMTEFRTAPLWGIAKSKPYMHSGEFYTLEEAIKAHQGEAAPSAAAYEALSEGQRSALIAFLLSL